eukprot:TRINITY_DN895_c0_g1_i4.p2 TRINITY_DN895_c0_g1~~TRINITY_DN895_c0_g1_i4.p2  ORF type:complete len:148 (+),score=27.88 TRINITY_DN895_c0_g1_i4:138-581(+)
MAGLNRRKPESLSKGLANWAEKRKKEAGESKANAVAEGLVKFTPSQLIEPKLPPDSQKASEVKYTAKGFKGFLNWMAKGHDSEENSVAEVIMKEKTEGIKVELAAPKKTSKGSARSGKRQGVPDKVVSCCKSVFKKAKLCPHHFVST